MNHYMVKANYKLFGRHYYYCNVCGRVICFGNWKDTSIANVEDVMIIFAGEQEVEHTLLYKNTSIDEFIIESGLSV